MDTEGVQQVATHINDRFWSLGGGLVRSLFGTAKSLPSKPVELHKMIVAERIIQLGSYPGFTSAVVDVLRKECVKSSEAIRCAAARIVEQLTMDASLYVYYIPDDACRNVTVRFSDRRYGTNVVNGSDVFVNALKAAFIRHLPDPERLKSVVASDTLHLSTFTETESVRDKRRDIDEHIARVRAATRELIKALDVDESKPLDGEWLVKLQTEHGLPQDQTILTEDPSVEQPEEAPKTTVLSVKQTNAKAKEGKKKK